MPRILAPRTAPARGLSKSEGYDIYYDYTNSVASRTCGGPSLMSVYNNTDVNATQTVVDGAGPTGVAAGIYQGCASEIPGSRALTGACYADVNGMTLESCGTFCFGRGFALAGTEYTQECFCGNALINGGQMLADNGTCNMLCRGNNGQTCGGSWRLSVFARPSGMAAMERRGRRGVLPAAKSLLGI